MKFTIVFLLLACVFAIALANPGQPWNPGQQRPVTIRPTSFPRPIRVRREALAIGDHLAADAIRPPPFLPA